MEAVISYAKTVLFFLLFVNLIMQLLKGSSYERFVHPVCGMILVVLMIRPVLAFFGGEESLLYAAEQKISLLLAQNGGAYFTPEEEEGGYEFAVLAAYEEELVVQLTGILEEEGLTVESVDFSLSAESDFGTIRTITVTARDGDGAKSGRIQIEPIVWEGRKREETVSAEEIRLKDKLADFYQVDEANIYVNIKEEQDG